MKTNEQQSHNIDSMRENDILQDKNIFMDNLIMKIPSLTIGKEGAFKGSTSTMASNNVSTMKTIAAKSSLIDRLKNLQIRTQILSGGIIALFLLMLVTTITFFSIGDLATISETIEVNSQTISSSQELVKILGDMERALIRYSLFTPSEIVDEYKSASKMFDSTIQVVYRRIADKPEQIKRLEQLKSQKQAWSSTLAEQIPALRQELISGTKTMEEFNAAARTSGNSSLQSMNSLVAEFISKEQQENYSLIRKSKIVVLVTKSSIITLTIFALGMVLFVLMIVSKNLARQIRSIAKAVVDVVKGNLDTSVNIHTTNEVGILARNFNLMVVSISNSIKELQREKASVVKKVQGAMADVKKQSQYLGNSVNTIMEEIQQLANSDLRVHLQGEINDAIDHLFARFNETLNEVNNILLTTEQVADSVYTTVATASETTIILQNRDAWLAIRKDNIGQAIELFEEITQSDPAYATAWYGWGLALSNQNKFEEAIDKYTIALHYKPDMMEALHNLGYCYIQLAEYSTALRKLNQAFELGADKVKIYRLRGLAYMQLKNYELAKQEYDNAISIQPTNNYLAYYHRGMIQMALSRPVEAYTDFQEAIKTVPNSTEKVTIMLLSNQALEEAQRLQSIEMRSQAQMQHKAPVEFR